MKLCSQEVGNNPSSLQRVSTSFVWIYIMFFWKQLITYKQRLFQESALPSQPTSKRTRLGLRAAELAKDFNPQNCSNAAGKLRRSGRHRRRLGGSTHPLRLKTRRVKERWRLIAQEYSNFITSFKGNKDPIELAINEYRTHQVQTVAMSFEASNLQKKGNLRWVLGQIWQMSRPFVNKEYGHTSAIPIKSGIYST